MPGPFAKHGVTLVCVVGAAVCLLAGFLSDQRDVQGVRLLYGMSVFYGGLAAMLAWSNRQTDRNAGFEQELRARATTGRDSLGPGTPLVLGGGPAVRFDLSIANRRAAWVRLGLLLILEGVVALILSALVLQLSVPASEGGPPDPNAAVGAIVFLGVVFGVVPGGLLISSVLRKRSVSLVVDDSGLRIEQGGGRVDVLPWRGGARKIILMDDRIPQGTSSSGLIPRPDLNLAGRAWVWTGHGTTYLTNEACQEILRRAEALRVPTASSIEGGSRKQRGTTYLRRSIG